VNMTKGTSHNNHSTYKEHLLYSTQEGTYVHSATINVIQTAVQNRR